MTSFLVLLNSNFVSVFTVDASVFGVDRATPDATSVARCDRIQPFIGVSVGSVLTVGGLIVGCRLRFGGVGVCRIRIVPDGTALIRCISADLIASDNVSVDMSSKLPKNSLWCLLTERLGLAVPVDTVS